MIKKTFITMSLLMSFGGAIAVVQPAAADHGLVEQSRMGELAPIDPEINLPRGPYLPHCVCVSPCNCPCLDYDPCVGRWQIQAAPL